MWQYYYICDLLLNIQKQGASSEYTMYLVFDHLFLKDINTGSPINFTQCHDEVVGDLQHFC